MKISSCKYEWWQMKVYYSHSSLSPWVGIHCERTGNLFFSFQRGWNIKDFNVFPWAFFQWGTIKTWQNSETQQCWNKWTFSPAQGAPIFHRRPASPVGSTSEVIENSWLYLSSWYLSLCIVSIFPVTMEDMVMGNVFFGDWAWHRESLSCSCKFLHSVMQLELATK